MKPLILEHSRLYSRLILDVFYITMQWGTSTNPHFNKFNEINELHLETFYN